MTLIKALEAHGAYYIGDEEEVAKIRNVVFEENGRPKVEVIGKAAFEVAAKAGIDVPKDTSILVVACEAKGSEDVLCGEKLCTVLILTTYDDFEEGVAIAKANLLYQGTGHSAVIHTSNKEKVEYAALKLPVGRLLVNVPGIAAGGGGFSPISIQHPPWAVAHGVETVFPKT